MGYIWAGSWLLQYIYSLFALRIFTVSDIHIDFKENRQWFNGISGADYTNDILILAGDITHKYQLFEDALRQLCNKFKYVFFVAGNHDLWVDDRRFANSYEKHLYLLEFCQRIGVYTEPVGFDGFVILPLYGWYDFSFGQPSEDLRNGWVDFEAFHWPQSHVVDAAPTYFMNQNTQHLKPYAVPVISFSHFMPRLDLLPERVNRDTYFLNPVLGSTRLDKQIRLAGSALHIYGHYHVNNQQHVQGVTYLNNAFGYPKEKHLTVKQLIEVLPSHYSGGGQ